MSKVINDQNVRPGSIHRIALEDFLTYSKVEFIAGTGLNLIIGPNGTGKSSFLCAIIIGLCGKISAIGRSKKLSDYIRSGCSKARIELELYRNPGETNIIITRHFTMEGVTTWYMDNLQVREKEVQSVIAGMNIQVDNLCQLLPQDRVQDFAKMDSHQLLRSTLLTIRGQKSIDQLDELIESTKKQKDMKAKSSTLQQNLTEQIKINERLKKDVDKMAERKVSEKRIRMCEIKMLFIQYEGRRSKQAEIKKECEAAEKVVNDYKAVLEPLQKAVEDTKEKLTTIEQLKLRDTRITIALKEKSEECIKAIRNLDYQLKDADTAFQERLEHSKNREAEIREEQNSYNKLLQNQGNLIAKIGDNVKIKMDLAEVEKPIMKTKAAIDQIKKKKLEVQYELENDVMPQIRSNQNKIKSLEDIDRKRLEVIRQFSQDSYQAVLWYRQNKSLFKCPSYEPMLLEINFKEAKFAQYLENTVSNRDLVAFTFESTSDMNLFLTTVRVKMGLKLVNAICSKECNSNLQRSPIEDLSYLGFYTYLSDTMTAPKAIMSYLNKLYRVHRIPIGNNHTYNNSGKVPDNISFFFTEKHRFSVRVSTYSGIKSSSITEIRPAKLLANTVNIIEVENYKKRLKSLETSVTKHNEHINTFNHKLAQLEDDLNQFVNARKIIRDRVEQVQAVTLQIKVQNKKLQDLKNEPKINIPRERAKYKQKQKEIILQQMQVCEEMVANAKALQTATLNADVWKLKLEMTRQLILEHQAKLRETKNEYSGALATLQNLENALAKAHKEAKNNLEEAKRNCNNKLPQDPGFPYKNEFKSLPSTMAELEECCSDLQTALLCMPPETEAVIKEYEDREKAIKRLKEESLNCEKFDKEVENRLNIIKSEWLPSLEDMVQRINAWFSTMFTELGCTGEVKLDKAADDDFSKYGIAIQVSFRSNESMNKLTGFTQSGGERALSIAIYLLALQKLSAVPFRCVDEINQGMDPINEKKMFQLLVKVTTELEHAQYFLLTPKLLQDLEYDDNVFVHTIMNGKRISSFDTAEICRKAQEIVKTSAVANLKRSKGIALAHP